MRRPLRSSDFAGPRRAVMSRWSQAKQLFGRRPRPQAPGTQGLSPERRPQAPPRTESKTETKTARSVCIVSGKGGTGKSSVSASLAALFGRRGRTLLLDADLGCANAHILQDVHPTHSFADVVAGDVGVADIVTPCGNGVDLLAGGSGFPVRPSRSRRPATSPSSSRRPTSRR